MLKYIAENGQIKRPDKFVQQLIEHLPEEETQMPTIAQYFRQEGVQQGMQQGMQQGVQRGIQQRNLEIAKKLLAAGVDKKIIADASGLSLSKINSLKMVH